jgi:hypothetical protein
MCADAFNAMAETASAVSHPNFEPFFASIQLSFDQFDRWRRARGYPKLDFWSAPVAPTGLQKRERGKPPEYDWKQVKTGMLKYAEENGPIRTEKQLIQKCGDIATSLHARGKTPDDKTIRAAIKSYGLDQPPICRRSQ